MITGGNNTSSETAVFEFAPLSTESLNSEDKYDIIVTTDVLSEGRVSNFSKKKDVSQVIFSTDKSIQLSN